MDEHELKQYELNNYLNALRSNQFSSCRFYNIINLPTSSWNLPDITTEVLA